MIQDDRERDDYQMSAGPAVTFRLFQGEADFQLMHAILVDSDRADRNSGTLSMDVLKSWCAPSLRFHPRLNILLALACASGRESQAIGFSRVGWYTGKACARLYYQDAFLHPDWRDGETWPALVRRGERRLREIAAGHPGAAQRYFQAWAAGTQARWRSVLAGEGYQAVRHFDNMVRPLQDIPDRVLPAGLEIRPARPEHYRSIWDAQKEVQPELFEFVAENWTEEKYQAWRDHPSHTPHLWQVAWDGDQVAGMVLTRVDVDENGERRRRRGYTEHIFVRRPWRGRGLAGALLASSLRVLQEQGMDEAELGVDRENESGAHAFYIKMGYQPETTDVWYRKPLD